VISETRDRDSTIHQPCIYDGPGGPWCSWIDGTANPFAMSVIRLNFSRALVSQPSSTNDWITTTITSYDSRSAGHATNNLTEGTCIVNVKGVPLVIYKKYDRTSSSSAKMEYIKATTSSPTSPADWIPYATQLLDGVNVYAQFPSITNIGDLPAIAYNDFATRTITYMSLNTTSPGAQVQSVKLDYIASAPSAASTNP
jgi:hypothetical protein